jgi:hypothetical protein
MKPQNIWPRGDEYQQAVQQPAFVFSDPDLKKCSAETDQLGLPKPYSGGFTTTYHLQFNSHHFAVRCFIRDVPDLQRRYAAIEDFFNANPHNFFIPAICLNRGIQVNTTWYPIIKMDWIDGVPLNTYIQKNLGNTELLERITNSFYTLVQNLEKIGIAHGDLQHGNIIVKNDDLYLIDYDGFFLPSIADLQGNEMGHPNYQHPLRARHHCGSTVDRFSAIVIYFALLALRQYPKLWNKYDTNENILFSRMDFIDYRHSKILEELAKYNDLSIFVERFRGVCRCEFDKIPTLDQFISGEFSYPEETVNENIEQSYCKSPQKPEESTSFTVEGYPVIQSVDLHQLSVHIGDWIGLEGVIDEMIVSSSNYSESDKPLVTLNFGCTPFENISLFIYPTTIDAFNRRNIKPETYVKKIVRVTGLVRQNNGKLGINLEVPSQIEIIKENNTYSISNSPQKCEKNTAFTVEGYPVIQSADLHQLSVHIGDWIGLEGVIDEINQSALADKDSNGPALTLSFGHYPRDNIYVHIYLSSLITFKKRNISPESFVNKHVRITGKLSQGQGKFRLNLEVPSQIMILECLKESSQTEVVPP